VSQTVSSLLENFVPSALNFFVRQNQSSNLNADPLSAVDFVCRFLVGVPIVNDDVFMQALDQIQAALTVWTFESILLTKIIWRCCALLMNYPGKRPRLLQ
jgi:hypothetical protein